MCRLFAFRSVLTSQVHSSLVSAENALIQQSNRHPDGWGVAYYVAGAPHIIRSVNTAIHDQLFAKVSGIVTSQTVLAHLRKATQGGFSVLETHPFQYGRWVFAHNGNITNFPKHRQKLLKQVDPQLAKFILGETDSELIFFLILTALAPKGCLEKAEIPVAEWAAAIRQVIQIITKLTGPLCPHDDASPKETFLTIIMSNGQEILAYQGGKSLYFSTHKQDCPETSHCAAFRPTCEQSAQKGATVSHLLLSSEPLAEGGNIWRAMKFDSFIAIDRNFSLLFL